jgi:superkiller protein 3
LFLTATFLFLGARPQNQEGFQSALERGLNAYQQGDFATAIESFEAALSLQPDHVRARFNLARALHRAGNLERALREILELEGRMGDRALYASTLGEIYAEMGRFEEALGPLTEAAELHPEVAQNQHRLGEVLAAQGRLLAAIERMTQAAELQPGWLLPRRRLGELWITLGAPAQAIEGLEQAAELAPDAPLVLLSLGRAYAIAGRHEDAVRVLDKALAARPEMAAGRALLADSLSSSGQLERAAAEYRTALEESPESTHLRSELAVTLFSLEQYEEAVRELERVIAQDPENGLALYHLGSIAAQRGEKDLARERLEQAVDALESQPQTMGVRTGRAGESYPLHVGAQVELAELLSESGEQDAAAKLLEAVIRVEPDHATAHYLLGLTYRRQEQRQEAERELILFKQINDAREHDQTAILSLQQGSEERALEELQEALRIYPADSVAHFQLARLYLKRGDLPTAIGHFEKAIEARPSFADAYKELTRVYCRQGDVDRARDLLRRARERGLVIPGVCIG